MNGHGGPLVFVSTRNLRCVYNWAGFKTKNTLFQAQGVRATKKSTHQHIIILASTVKKLFFFFLGKMQRRHCTCFHVVFGGNYNELCMLFKDPKIQL